MELNSMSTQIIDCEQNPVYIDDFEGRIVSTIEAEESELLDKSVTHVEEAYQMYNEYAFRIGLSVQYYKTRKRNNGVEIKGQEFWCNKEGLKDENANIKY